MIDKRALCEWSDLSKDECDHCRDGHPPHERTTMTVLSELRADVLRALEQRTLSVTWPLPRIKSVKVGAPARAPRWNPGNVAAQIGGDLTLIESMFTALQDEAETRYRDREFPGGDALVMLGPGPEVEAFNYRQISALVGRISESEVEIANAGDIEPPLSFLAGWTDVIRAERNQPTALRATISREIAYIRKSIDWMMSTDESGDMNFIQVDDLAEQLGKVRRRMEDVLKDGTRSEFTRVNCISPECERQPRLMKLWAAQVRWDRYRCPACRVEYDADQFKMARAQNLHSRGATKFVTSREAADATGVPIKTIYSWMLRGNITRGWAMPAGTPLPWWPDVRDRAVERAARLKAEGIKRAERKAAKEAEEKAKKDATERELMAS